MRMLAAGFGEDTCSDAIRLQAADSAGAARCGGFTRCGEMHAGRLGSTWMMVIGREFSQA